jgi:hypothetical protein
MTILVQLRDDADALRLVDGEQVIVEVDDSGVRIERGWRPWRRSQPHIAAASIRRIGFHFQLTRDGPLAAQLTIATRAEESTIDLAIADLHTRAQAVALVEAVAQRLGLNSREVTQSSSSLHLALAAAGAGAGARPRSDATKGGPHRRAGTAPADLRVVPAALESAGCELAEWKPGERLVIRWPERAYVRAPRLPSALRYRLPRVLRRMARGIERRVAGDRRIELPHTARIDWSAATLTCDHGLWRVEAGFERVLSLQLSSWSFSGFGFAYRATLSAPDLGVGAKLWKARADQRERALEIEAMAEAFAESLGVPLVRGAPV